MSKFPLPIPKGYLRVPIISSLSRDGIILNVTAIMTVDQVRQVAAALPPKLSRSFRYSRDAWRIPASIPFRI